MTIEEQLQKLEEHKNELFFKEISKEQTQIGDLVVRDETGIVPIYFRPVSIEEAHELILSDDVVTIIPRESKLGQLFLEETKGNNNANS